MNDSLLLFIFRFKPVDLVFAVNPIKDKFMSLFCSFTGFGNEQNKKCQDHINVSIFFFITHC